MQFDFDVKFLPGGWKPLAREGDLDHWENKCLVKTESSDAELLQSILIRARILLNCSS